MYYHRWRWGRLWLERMWGMRNNYVTHYLHSCRWRFLVCLSLQRLVLRITQQPSKCIRVVFNGSWQLTLKKQHTTCSCCMSDTSDWQLTSVIHHISSAPVVDLFSCQLSIIVSLTVISSEGAFSQTKVTKCQYFLKQICWGDCVSLAKWFAV